MESLGKSLLNKPLLSGPNLGYVSPSVSTLWLSASIFQQHREDLWSDNLQARVLLVSFTRYWILQCLISNSSANLITSTYIYFWREAYARSVGNNPLGFKQADIKCLSWAFVKFYVYSEILLKGKLCAFLMKRIPSNLIELNKVFEQFHSTSATIIIYNFIWNWIGRKSVMNILFKVRTGHWKTLASDIFTFYKTAENSTTTFFSLILLFVRKQYHFIPSAHWDYFIYLFIYVILLRILFPVPSTSNTNNS